jgi:exodeoxyribonuclease VII small subunit
MSGETELDFEAALARLEGLVRELEAGELGLEESLARFEEGVRLIALCSGRLRSAEVRLERLEETSDGLVGRPIDEPGDEGAEE